MGYNGNWLDSFNVYEYQGEERPNCKGKIVLETPHIDYFFTKEQWSEFKEKINKV